MTFVEKRRLSAEDVAILPLPQGIDRADVAEAWVDDSGKIEIVLRGFLKRIVVQVSCEEKTSP